MEIKKDLLTINFTKGRQKPIEGIVLHSMWGTYQGSISWFKNQDAKASAHYLISKGGEITQMVEDSNTAWHAGIIDDVAPEWVKPNPNFNTIGIELEDERSADWSYPEPQREALRWLLNDLMGKYAIGKDKILLHKELNPSRRSDPVGRFSLEWVFPVIVEEPVYPETLIVLKLLEDFKNLNNHGSLEGALRALIGAYQDHQWCQMAKEAEVQLVRNECQEKTFYLEEKIKKLEVGLAENMDWFSLFKIFWRKIKSGEPTST